MAEKWAPAVKKHVVQCDWKSCIVAVNYHSDRVAHQANVYSSLRQIKHSLHKSKQKRNVKIVRVSYFLTNHVNMDSRRVVICRDHCDGFLIQKLGAQMAKSDSFCWRLKRGTSINSGLWKVRQLSDCPVRTQTSFTL